MDLKDIIKHNKEQLNHIDSSGIFTRKEKYRSDIVVKVTKGISFFKCEGMIGYLMHREEYLSVVFLPISENEGYHLSLFSNGFVIVG